MVADLDFPIDVVGVPTQRDDDGLALSSRNIYLDEEQRAKAVALPRALGVAARASTGRGTSDRFGRCPRDPDRRRVRGRLCRAGRRGNTFTRLHRRSSAPSGGRCPYGIDQLIDNIAVTDLS